MQLKDLGLLERCLKETLRLRPPIMTMMRMARSPQVKANRGCKHTSRGLNRLCRHYVSPATIHLTRNCSSLLSRFTQTAAGFTIPVGHQVCVSPTVNHRLYDTWDERMEFKPDRYLEENPAAGEKFAYVPFGAGRRIKKEYFRGAD